MKQICHHFSPRKGDVIRLDYQPGRGTTVTIDNEPRGTIEGEDFMPAWLSIWLGARPAEAAGNKQPSISENCLALGEVKVFAPYIVDQRSYRTCNRYRYREYQRVGHGRHINMVSD